MFGKTEKPAILKKSNLPKPKISYILFLFCALASFLPACKTTNETNPVVVVKVPYGEIEIALFPQQAPQTVASFLRYVDSGYYENAHFYRILSLDNQPMGSNASELIQGGLWANPGSEKKLPGIPHESTAKSGLTHKNGAVSLARQEPGTGTTEFFICLGDQPGFDFGGANNPDGQGYAVFGQVIKGMDLVKKIYRQPENNQYFEPPVKIWQIRRKR